MAVSCIVSIHYSSYDGSGWDFAKMSPRSIHTIPSGIIHCSDTYLHHHHHSHARNAIQQKRDNSSDIKQHQAENSIDSVQDRPYQEPEGAGAAKAVDAKDVRLQQLEFEGKCEWKVGF